MALPPFKDFYKPLKDFFTKSYDIGKQKVEIKHKSDTLEFNPVIERDGADFKGTLSVEASGVKPCDWATLKIKSEITNKGKLTVKATAEQPEKWPGYKLEGTAELDTVDNKKDTYTALLTHTSATSVVTVSGKAKGDAITLEPAVVAKIGSIIVAANAELDGGFGVKQWTAGGSIRQKSHNVTAVFEGFDKLKVGYVAPVSEQLTVGAEWAAEFKNASPNKITVGIESKHSGATIKGTVDTNGDVRAAWIYKLNKEWKATISAQHSLKTQATQTGLTFSLES